MVGTEYCSIPKIYGTRRKLPWMTGSLPGQCLLLRHQEIAEQHHATPRQVVLQFLLRRFGSFAILKTSTPEAYGRKCSSQQPSVVGRGHQANIQSVSTWHTLESATYALIGICWLAVKTFPVAQTVAFSESGPVRIRNTCFVRSALRRIVRSRRSQAMLNPSIALLDIAMPKP